MIAVMPAFCLAFHAGYTCRHSGACCSAGWRIPAEAAVLATVAARGIRSAGGGGVALFEPVEGGAGTTHWVGRTDEGCVFYERDRQGLCSIHRLAGASALPSACRNFPRVVLHDRRGLFVTLSHFCPTAAGLLLEAEDIRIVDAPPALSLDATAEGLDATAVMPPLLRPGMLTDLDGYDAWERGAIAVLGERQGDVDEALRAIRHATARVVEWKPGAAPLRDRVIESFARARADIRPTTAGADDRALRAFAASHLFASWVAYQGRGLLDVVSEVERAVSLLREQIRSGRGFVEAARAADLRLRHSAEPGAPGVLSGSR